MGPEQAGSLPKGIEQNIPAVMVQCRKIRRMYMLLTFNNITPVLTWHDRRRRQSLGVRGIMFPIFKLNYVHKLFDNVAGELGKPFGVIKT